LKLSDPKVLAPEAPADAIVNMDAAALKDTLGLDFSDEPAAQVEGETVAEEAADVTKDTSAQSPAAEPAKEEEEAAPADATKPEPTKPEGAEAGATESVAKPPLTKFKLSDKEGELEAPELFFDFKADGKDYEKVPLEKVVAFAQMGIYNERRQRETMETQQRASQLEAQMQEFQARERETDAAIERLFSDPLYFERAKELYLAQHSPESRASRAEQELQQHREQQAREREDQQIGSFTSQVLSPTVEALKQQNPLVSEAELVGQFSLLTAPLLVRGRVPPDRLHNVQTLVEHDLATWARTLQVEREGSKKRETASQTATKTQLAATKRQLARAVAPRGQAAPPAPAKPKKFDSAEDWMKTLGGHAPGAAE
jgi:hypothetical protein